MKWYFKVFRQYADFTGRARRKEYWMFHLFHLIILIPLILLDEKPAFIYNEYDTPIISVIEIIVLIYFLIALIPTLAVTVRRLHDTGRSGWWYLITFVPYVGNLIILIFACYDSQYGKNKWGPNPKGIGNGDEIEDIGTE